MSEDESHGVRIPHDELTPDALRGVISELVTRDGTEHSESERKIGEVLDLLRRGRAEIWFDADSRTCSLVPTV